MVNINKVYLKNDIIKYMSKETGLSQEKCRYCLNAYQNLMLEVVKNRDIIQDRGFLTILTKFVPSHLRGDPRDNSVKIKVPDKYKVVIKAGKYITNALKEIQFDKNIK